MSTRLRWAALGAATAIALGGSITWVAQAATGGGGGNTYTPITPCRLVDTRPGSNQVGERSGALTAGESVVLTVHGSNGRCTIGSDATGIATNVTVLQGTAASFLTVHPAHVSRPLASNLNWVAGQPATPNQVTVGLSPDGKVRAYNDRGTVHLIIDIVGLYTAAGAGAQGPAGPRGPAGPAGNIGPAGADGTDALAGQACAAPLVVVGFDLEGDVLCSSPVDLDGDGFFVDPWNTGLGQPWDCDDTDPTIFPGAEEILDDGIDQDCDGFDQVTAIDCNDSNPYTTDTWDALSQSCVHEALNLDLDEDGFTAQQAVGGTPDCDDTDPNVYPGAVEVANGIDDNCDGQIDEGLP